ncbi:MAG TPA: exodeoxyribonuclease VII small subunit [Erysipelotrichaceae bacterium]|nr:exodeoxyribonuclease VII small subunit [Erysipelotrichaceae bacterium]
MSEFDFEKAIKRIEEINEKLSSGNVSLDESMKLFEEGLQLIQASDKKLKGFEASINDLVEKYQGV